MGELGQDVVEVTVADALHGVEGADGWGLLRHGLAHELRHRGVHRLGTLRDRRTALTLGLALLGLLTLGGLLQALLGPGFDRALGGGLSSGSGLGLGPSVALGAGLDHVVGLLGLRPEAPTVELAVEQAHHLAAVRASLLRSLPHAAELTVGLRPAHPGQGRSGGLLVADGVVEAVEGRGVSDLVGDAVHAVAVEVDLLLAVLDHGGAGGVRRRRGDLGNGGALAVHLGLVGREHALEVGAADVSFPGAVAPGHSELDGGQLAASTGEAGGPVTGLGLDHAPILWGALGLDEPLGDVDDLVRQQLASVGGGGVVLGGVQEDPTGLLDAAGTRPAGALGPLGVGLHLDRPRSQPEGGGELANQPQGALGALAVQVLDLTLHLRTVDAAQQVQPGVAAVLQPTEGLAEGLLDRGREDPSGHAHKGLPRVANHLLGLADTALALAEQGVDGGDEVIALHAALGLTALLLALLRARGDPAPLPRHGAFGHRHRGPARTAGVGAGLQLGPSGQPAGDVAWIHRPRAAVEHGSSLGDLGLPSLVGARLVAALVLDAATRRHVRLQGCELAALAGPLRDVVAVDLPHELQGEAVGLVHQAVHAPAHVQDLGGGGVLLGAARELLLAVEHVVLAAGAVVAAVEGAGGGGVRRLAVAVAPGLVVVGVEVALEAVVGLVLLVVAVGLRGPLVGALLLPVLDALGEVSPGVLVADLAEQVVAQLLVRGDDILEELDEVLARVLVLLELPAAVLLVLLLPVGVALGALALGARCALGRLGGLGVGLGRSAPAEDSQELRTAALEQLLEPLVQPLVPLWSQLCPRPTTRPLGAVGPTLVPSLHVGLHLQRTRVGRVGTTAPEDALALASDGGALRAALDGHLCRGGLFQGGLDRRGVQLRGDLMGHALGFLLHDIRRGADLQPLADGAKAALLVLHHVSELVGEQVLTLLGGDVEVLVEVDVLPHGVGLGANGAAGLASGGVGVDAHTAEVHATKGGLHLLSDPLRHGLAASGLGTLQTLRGVVLEGLAVRSAHHRRPLLVGCAVVADPVVDEAVGEELVTALRHRHATGTQGHRTVDDLRGAFALTGERRLDQRVSPGPVQARRQALVVPLVLEQIHGSTARAGPATVAVCWPLQGLDLLAGLPTHRAPRILGL